MRIAALLGTFALGFAATGCGSGDDPEPARTAAAAAPTSDLPQGSEPVKLDPADFTTDVDNPYWPLAPGSRWVYRETGEKGAEQRVVVTVTDRAKVVSGVKARVVHDVVTQDGELVEDTYDWYAQDRAGNVWYLGEDTREYENGEVATTEGSWEAGVDGAQAGIIMPADPRVGMRYRQEYYAGQAEDRAEVERLGDHCDVPAGSFSGVLVTKETNPLGSGTVEHKFYARDAGLVQVVGGGGHREELLRFDRGSG
jgi:hypothetical protein